VIPKVVSSYGFQSFSAPDSYGFHFAPRCKAGACDELLGIEGPKVFRIRLTRTGARYAGSATGAFNVRCGSAHPVSTITVELRVRKAADVGGAWDATRFLGTLT
jgi:hypothetical protein